MRPQSLAWYFPSKNALYDAPHAQGNEEFLRRLEAAAGPLDVHRAARGLRRILPRNPGRYQLLTRRSPPRWPGARSARGAPPSPVRASPTGTAWTCSPTAVVKGVVDQQITVKFVRERRLGPVVDVSCVFSWPGGRTSRVEQELRRADDGRNVAELRSVADPGEVWRRLARRPEMLGLAAPSR